MKCRLIHNTKKALPDRGYFPAGTIIDVRTSERFNREHIIILVQMGAAEPADEECKIAVHAKFQGKTEKEINEQLKAARRSYCRVRKGIAPEDFAAFDAGIMDGYDRKGEPVPGPNYVEPEDEEEEEEEDDE